MASGKTTTLQNNVIDHRLRGTASSGATTAYLALFSTAPTEAGTGTELTVANNYARIACGFTAASSGATANAAEVLFTATGGAWSAIVGHALYDQAAVGGNMLYYQDTVSGPTLADGDSYKFDAGDIDASET